MLLVVYHVVHNSIGINAISKIAHYTLHTPAGSTLIWKRGVHAASGCLIPSYMYRLQLWVDMHKRRCVRTVASEVPRQNSCSGGRARGTSLAVVEDMTMYTLYWDAK